MVNKKRTLLIMLYSLFSVLILIGNIGDGLLNKLILELAYVIGSADPTKVSNLFDIFKLVFNLIIYTTFGIVAFYLFLSCFDEIKYVIIYSIIVNVAIIVVSMIIIVTIVVFIVNAKKLCYNSFDMKDCIQKAYLQSIFCVIIQKEE